MPRALAPARERGWRVRKQSPAAEEEPLGAMSQKGVRSFRPPSRELYANLGPSEPNPSTSAVNARRDRLVFDRSLVEPPLRTARSTTRFRSRKLVSERKKEAEWFWLRCVG